MHIFGIKKNESTKSYEKADSGLFKIWPQQRKEK